MEPGRWLRGCVSHYVVRLVATGVSEMNEGALGPLVVWG